MLNLEQQNRLREQFRRQKPEWRPATETYSSLARSHLEASSQVLDLGCGRGGLIEQMDHPTALTTGVDPDWQSLNEHRLPGIRRVAATSDSLPFSAQTYDLILASWILEHLPFPADTLQQVWRILKPGGAFIFITPNGRHPAAQLNRLLGRLAGLQNILVEQLYGRDRVDTFPTYYRANTRERLYQLANQAGLQLVDLVTVPDPTYLAFSPSMFRLARLIEDNISASRHIHLVGVMRRLE